MDHNILDLAIENLLKTLMLSSVAANTQSCKYSMKGEWEQAENWREFGTVCAQAHASIEKLKGYL